VILKPIYLIQKKKLLLKDNKDREKDEKKYIVNKNKRKRLDAQTSGCFKIFFIFRPISIILGVIFFLLSFAICLSVALTLINRLLNHMDCGVICGFVLKVQKIPNPIDYALVFLSNLFPADFVVITSMILYLYLCTLSAITRIGIRVCCYKLFPIRKGRTQPQALLIASIMLMLSILALTNLVTNVAPTYTMFGSQTAIVNSTTVHCSIENYNSTHCVMTEVGELINLVNLTVPFMGLVFFAMLCLFIVIWIISIFIAGFAKKSSIIDEHSSDDEESENFN